jgi:hypothetical protein
MVELTVGIACSSLKVKELSSVAINIAFREFRFTVSFQTFVIN